MKIEHNVPKASHSAWCVAGSHVCLASFSSLLLKHMPGIVNKKQNIYTQGQGNCTPIRIWVKAKKGEADRMLINMPWVLTQGYSWSVKINSKILTAKLKGNKINHIIILSISSSMNIQNGEPKTCLWFLPFNLVLRTVISQAWQIELCPLLAAMPWLDLKPDDGRWWLINFCDTRAQHGACHWVAT